MDLVDELDGKKAEQRPGLAKADRQSAEANRRLAKADRLGSEGAEDRAARFDALIRSISRQVRKEVRPLAESLGLTWARLWVLIEVRRTPGLTMGMLAKHLGLSRSTATSLVDELVRQGLLRRESDPADRRVLRVFPLPSGIDLLEQVLERRRAIMGEAFGELSSGDIEAALRVLERVDAALRQDERPAPGEEEALQ